MTDSWHNVAAGDTIYAAIYIDEEKYYCLVPGKVKRIDKLFPDKVIVKLRNPQVGRTVLKRFFHTANSGRIDRKEFGTDLFFLSEEECKQTIKDILQKRLFDLFDKQKNLIHVIEQF